MITIKKGTNIRTWDQTGSKDAEFRIFLEKPKAQFDVAKINESIKDTGITTLLV